MKHVRSLPLFRLGGGGGGKGKSEQPADFSQTDGSESSDDTAKRNHQQSTLQPSMPKGSEKRRTSPAIPPRRLTSEDKVLLNVSTWSNVADLKLEDPVSIPDATYGALQGIVAFVGEVHFADGIWVGVQLTGPSIGKGNCDGSRKGTRYFSNVGRKNGMLTPISDVHKRDVVGSATADTKDAADENPEAQIAAVKYVETLKKERASAILRQNEAQVQRRWIKTDTEEIYIKRLKEQRLDELRWTRTKPKNGVQDDIIVGTKKTRKPRFGGINSRLCRADYDLVVGLQEADLGFVITDPLLPDNPVTYASQQFLRTTGHSLNQILGQNCRFLQGPDTDPKTVEKVRTSIREGSDCSVKILNYRADGTTFWNQFFITALRDARGRVKNYLGCQCEISPEAFLAEYKSSKPVTKRSKQPRTKSSLRSKSESKVESSADADDGPTTSEGPKVKFEESTLTSSSGNSTMRPSRSMPDLRGQLDAFSEASAPAPPRAPTPGPAEAFRAFEQQQQQQHHMQQQQQQQQQQQHLMQQQQQQLGGMPMPFYPPYFPGGQQWYAPGYPPPYPGQYMMPPGPMNTSASSLASEEQGHMPPHPTLYSMPPPSFLPPNMQPEGDYEPDLLNMHGMYMGPPYMAPPVQAYQDAALAAQLQQQRGRESSSNSSSRGRRSRSKSKERRRRSTTPTPEPHWENMYSPQVVTEVQYTPKERKAKKKSKVKKERKSPKTKPKEYLADHDDPTRQPDPNMLPTMEQQAQAGIIHTDAASTLDDELSKIVCLVQTELSKIDECDENVDDSMHPPPTE
mmetsp:Transcript_41066/g.60814  ORF Transcript_41066/g.60814 Transcript_41066/m.60814 type:complete len:796 (+) Transcript_41066:176-2563(+)|eukprot:CAMPEP_0194027976 /NCGR_PEP_ID=MMETSP0009_2-20130614/2006_1 /TAXON_ID=210454 /ORGANISM="Grammatophora oceanica, Strain CCMP 410" /LENGTH=795 /DNA_ID=CAMNT_0038667197 /DNA_START=113 /DNA_END=2500 /DNA_ORIENTATION=-